MNAVKHDAAKLADLFGRRSVFLVSVGLFSSASLLYVVLRSASARRVSRSAECRGWRDSDVQLNCHERPVSASPARTMAGHQQHRFRHRKHALSRAFATAAPLKGHLRLERVPYTFFRLRTPTTVL
jgi:hypothetical protein